MANQRFRADHIASLIRPPYLLEAQHAVTDQFRMHSQYKADADPALIQAAQDAEKRAIKDVVAEQVKRGITPITSGEFLRPSFAGGFFEKLEGIEIQFTTWPKFRTEFPIIRPYLRLNVPGRDLPIATGKVRFKGSAYMEEWMAVRGLLAEERWKDVKITIPAPNWTHTQLLDGGAYAAGVYGSDEEYLRDVGEAVRQEVLALYDAGVRFVQIDDPMLAMCVDQAYLDAQKADGKDLDSLLDPAIFAHNTILKDLPSDLTIAMHLCRGNLPKGNTAAIGGFDSMAPKLFRDLHYKRFALEFDDPEITGSLSPLQHLPAGKVVVLGLVTTKISELESIDSLKSQVYEAADIIAKAQNKSREEVVKDNLAVSPSCGFASVSSLVGTGMNEDVQWQKLELVKKLAEEVWGSSA